MSSAPVVTRMRPNQEVERKKALHDIRDITKLIPDALRALQEMINDPLNPRERLQATRTVVDIAAQLCVDDSPLNRMIRDLEINMTN